MTVFAADTLERLPAAGDRHARRPISSSIRVLLLALVLVASAVLASGCSIPPDTFPITFVNDTPSDVVLNLCDDDACHHFDYSDPLRSGRSVAENISTGNVFTRWAVTDGSGRRVGCLPFDFAGAYVNAVARLSQIVRCPGTRPLPLASGSPGHG